MMQTSATTAILDGSRAPAVLKGRSRGAPSSRTQSTVRDPSDTEDILKVEDFLAGKAGAFEFLFDKYREKVYGIAYRFVRNKEDALEVTQEVFLRLFRHRARYRPHPGSRFRAFLMRIARNVYIDVIRKQRRTVRCVELHEATLPAHAAVDARVGDAIDLEGALASLSEKLRWVLVLNIWEGLEYADVAAVLGIPVGTVKSRIHYALCKLREVLHVDALS